MTIPHTSCGECGSTLLICASCEKPFPRRGHEDELSWGVRRYCSTTCAAAGRHAIAVAGRILAQKPCQRPGCEEMATQRPTESPTSFEGRKYCSARCGHLIRSQPNAPHRNVKRKAPKEPKPVVEAVPEPKVLIRQVQPGPLPKPEPQVWRPAAWREMAKR